MLAYMESDDQLLTSAEYAHLLGVSTGRLYKMAKAGTLFIKPVRIGPRTLRWSIKDHRAAVARANEDG